MSKLILEKSLPVGWVETIIEDISTNDKGSIRMGPFGSQLKKHELVESGIRVLWIENIVNNKFEYKKEKFITKTKFEMLKGFVVKPNDILVTMMGTIGRTCVVPENLGQAIISSHLLKITPQKELIDSKFLTYLLRGDQKVLKQIESRARGVVMKGLNTKIIKSLEFSLPPLNEQKRIVEKIEELFLELNNIQITLKKTKQNLKEYQQSLLKSAFEGKLSKKWRERNNDNSEQGKNQELPEGWIMQKLEGLAEIIMGQAPPSHSYNNFEDGTVFVKVGEFGKVYPKKVVWTTKPLKHAQKKDVLICVVGATIGKINLGIDCAIGRSVSAIRPKESIMLQKFLFYFLKPMILKIRNEQQGSAQGIITIKYLESITIPIPPIIEQQEIVRRIEEGFSLIENTENIINSVLLQLDTLHLSIFKQAFEGKLIPQDPNDEPAEILLQKIKQEKERLIQKQKASRKKKNVK